VIAAVTMGRKKFIDKKHATTYTLVYRSTEGNDEPDNSTEGDRVLVPAAEQGNAAAAALPQDPRALYARFFGEEEEEDVGVIKHVQICCVTLSVLSEAAQLSYLSHLVVVVLLLLLLLLCPTVTVSLLLPICACS
jgi:hypothetical protein